MPKHRSKYRREDDDPEIKEDPPLQIIPRSEWTNEPAKSENGSLEHPCLDVVVTHTESDRCKNKDACIELIQEIYENHLEKGLEDIAHNFLIGEDGNIYEGRGWRLKPYPIRRIKDKESSDAYIQVAFIGTFGDGDGPERRPTMELCYGLQDLVEYGMDKGYLERGTIPPPHSRLPLPTSKTEVDVSQFDSDDT